MNCKQILDSIQRERYMDKKFLSYEFQLPTRLQEREKIVKLFFSDQPRWRFHKILLPSQIIRTLTFKTTLFTLQIQCAVSFLQKMSG